MDNAINVNKNGFIKEMIASLKEIFFTERHNNNMQDNIEKRIAEICQVEKNNGGSSRISSLEKYPQKYIENKKKTNKIAEKIEINSKSNLIENTEKHIELEGEGRDDR